MFGKLQLDDWIDLDKVGKQIVGGSIEERMLFNV